jgi:putative MATE family efflux protein
MRVILALGLPIIGGMVSQNVLNIVDTLMVSRLGKEAVGAVGAASAANFLATAFITGLSAGVQAMASRRKGEGRHDETAIPLNGGLILVACLAIPLSIALIIATPYLFPLLQSDELISELGVPYLQVRLIAMTAMGANFAFRGYWNGVSMSRLYLRTLVVMHVTNIVLNYAFIFGELGAPEMGATGAAIGTTVSTFVGTAYYFYLGRRYAREGGFLRGVPGWETIKTMLRISTPSGIQQMFFAAGLTALYTIVGHIGPTEVAALNVLLQVMLVAILPGLGLGLAAASLVGQALGRKDLDDAYAWGWDVSRAAVLIISVIALPMLLVPDLIIEQFFDKEPEALAMAILPLRLVGATIAFDAIGMVLLNALIGAGATRMAMKISVIAQWGVFLPVAVLVGPVLGGGLLAVWIAQLCYRGGQTVVLTLLWRSRRWANIDV